MTENFSQPCFLTLWHHLEEFERPSTEHPQSCAQSSGLCLCAQWTTKVVCANHICSSLSLWTLEDTGSGSSLPYLWKLSASHPVIGSAASALSVSLLTCLPPLVPSVLKLSLPPATAVSHCLLPRLSPSGLGSSLHLKMFHFATYLLLLFKTSCSSIYPVSATAAAPSRVMGSYFLPSCAAALFPSFLQQPGVVGPSILPGCGLTAYARMYV